MTEQRLSAEFVDALPIEYQFDSAGYVEEWDVHPSCRGMECATCHGTGEIECHTCRGKGLIPTFTEEDGEGVDECLDCGGEELACDDCDGTGWVESDDGDAGMPVMNYAYPIGNSVPDNVGRLIADLPLTVVEIGGHWHLALTGGGMDLSWEICEGYRRLGFLPPAHYAKVPLMAGRGERETDRKTLWACRKSLYVALMRATWALEDFDKRWASKLAPEVDGKADRDGAALRTAFLDKPCDEATVGAFADWLEENGDSDGATKVRGGQGVSA